MTKARTPAARAKRPPLTSLRCALCNRRLRKGEYVRSTHTRLHYCGPAADLERCRKIHESNRRKGTP